MSHTAKMGYRFRWCRTAALVIGIGFLTGSAADDEAVKVLDRYTEAIGGRAKLDEIRTVIVKGTFSLPEMGMYAPIETYNQVPDKSFTKVDIGQFGTSMSGVNGDVVWDINPLLGPRILKGDERFNRLRQAQVDPFANWKDNFTGIELAGMETIDGAECSKLILTPPEGEPLDCFFNNETGLLVKVAGNIAGQTMETLIKNYQEVGGIKTAHLVEIFTPQMSFTVKLDTIEYNGDIPEEKFALPSQIQALVDSQ